MTIGSEAIGSFAVASTNRVIGIGVPGPVSATGEVGVGVAGQATTGQSGATAAVGEQGQAISGSVQAGIQGAALLAGQIGQPVSGHVLTAVTGTIDATGLEGAAISGSTLVGITGTLDVSGQTGVVLSGLVLIGTASSITVRGYEGTIVYTVAVQPQQNQYLDLVNEAMNDVFGTTVYYVKDGVTYPISGTFTDEAEEIGLDGEIITTSPMVQIRRADMPYQNAPIENEVMTINGTTYRVWHWRRDGSDAYLIALKAAY